MDPVSLAGSVAGLASLGIQVTSGITTYLDAVKCRDEDLVTIRRQNAALRALVAAIKATSTAIPQLSQDVVAAATQSIQTCTEDLDALEAFISHLSGSDISTWRLGLKYQARKLHLAFDRSKINQLSRRIFQSKATLQLAVGELGLRIWVGATDTKPYALSRRWNRRVAAATRDSFWTDCRSDVWWYPTTSFQERIAGIEGTLQKLVAASERDVVTPGDTISFRGVAARLAAKPAALEEMCSVSAPG
ncbi:hypothetical protein PG994_004982 [Apiospora phragmitis]|uniref:Fungal N-terminal domain-containing protein n=1 Tax=Apiospora phragmitis TaxID=2905665 RepID=A0ABR1VS49_9PEZI